MDELNSKLISSQSSFCCPPGFSPWAYRQDAITPRAPITVNLFIFFLSPQRVCMCEKLDIRFSMGVSNAWFAEAAPRRHPGTPGPENRSLPVFHELEYTEGFRYLRYFQHVSAQFQ